MKCESREREIKGRRSSMGKPASCFKLIVCGGDAAEKDDCQVAEVSLNG